MPLARIEIEQITGSGWVARVEAQDFNMNARGLNLRADSFDEIMILVEDGYREIVPLEASPSPPEWATKTRSGVEASPGPPLEWQTSEDVVEAPPGPPLRWQKPTAPEPHPHVEPNAVGPVGPATARDVKQPPRVATESARTQPPVRIDAPTAKPRGDQAPFVPRR